MHEDPRSTLISVARKWVARLMLLLCLAVVGLAGAQVATGRYQAHPVLTGSMRPGFALGSVVVVKQVPVSSLAVRDVIIFHKPNNPSEYVVHRIVKITDRGGARVVETKGDNNPVNDPWEFTLRGNTAYQAQYTIPFVGYAALWLHRPSTRRYAALACGLVLLVSAGSVLLKRDDAAADENETDDVPPLPDEELVSAGTSYQGEVPEHA